MNPAEQQFRSGESRSDLLAGIFGLVSTMAVMGRPGAPREAHLLALGGFCFLIGRAIWRWRRPYMRWNDERLVVFARGRPKHVIAWAEVACVRHDFNATTLRMQDGTEIAISHLNFILSTDAQRFRQLLEEKLPERSSQEPAPAPAPT